ncbi:8-amino-7-oxononanoate synthase [Streptomyces mobaraensis NBRC 13819 = DSM 40847]|uniref:8-amino-7-oxononanoate synthase n=1 Tax=Streptomyces mobaraensis (strain ATCC 29032 / DSM 40847 / JCM 4168 / NBRC 13819 / NCIMB 11159 / IPCR 16-22) TaxID=1223523 RepID=M3C689_STRM1|nr:8-amino-7-oxononanoate synthase [Streptomyces mobaraensis]EME99421.1 8-amino-7-oxononanoate synthase [Streptomyces mobaraensis NBRC 13819 = DSM 40847]QTT77101.1 8-amino-7-oxononanoate synthase [Streptomyces mobaraensis NBRC 13819 = DSM 40847]
MPHDSAHSLDSVFDWIDAQHRARRDAGLARTLRPRPARPSGDTSTTDLAGNDYLGLCRHPRVTRAAAAAAHRWGAGATGSRLVSGSTELHAELERSLAEFCGFEAALVLSSGYAANLAAVTALAAPPDPAGTPSLLVSDEGNHASLIDGCRLARARKAVVPHADPAAVRKALTAHPGRALVVTDSVFSVDGDAAPLADLARVCRERGAGLLVDDAHGLGVLGEGGRGAPHAAGLAGAADVVATVTLSKSLGSQGGAVLGPARVITHLVNTARTFVFDTGLAPAAAGAALAALDVLRREPDRVTRVRAVAGGLHRRLTAAGFTAVRPDAAVVSVRAPTPEAAVRWQAACRAEGLAVGCFRPPSVPDGVSRLRLTARADLSDREVEQAVATIVRTAPAGARGLRPERRL